MRKCPLHYLPVLQHIRDSGGTTKVVFQDIKLAIAVADEISPGDVTPHALRRTLTDAHRPECRRAFDQFGGDYLVANDPLLVVDIAQEQIEGRDPLAQPAVDGPPLFSGDDSREDIEGPHLLGAVRMPVNGKRDPKSPQHGLGGRLLPGEVAFGESHHLVSDAPEIRPGKAVLTEQLVEAVRPRIGIVRHGRLPQERSFCSTEYHQLPISNTRTGTNGGGPAGFATPSRRDNRTPQAFPAKPFKNHKPAYRIWPATDFLRS